MALRRATWVCLVWLVGCNSALPGEEETDKTTLAIIDASKSVLTQHNNNQRTGAFLNETILTPSRVAGGLNRLASLAVDGQVYAQPLYAFGANVNVAPRNVVFLATMHNSVYAYDADSYAWLWETHLGGAYPIFSSPTSLKCAPPPVGDPLPPPSDPSCAYTDPSFGKQYAPYHDISVEVGILSTPVIDPATQIMYLVREFVSTPAAAKGDPHTYTYFGEQHIVYRGTDNHVHELWTNEEDWEHPHHHDLSAAAGAPNAAGDPYGFTTETDSVQHVVYRGTDNKIWELYDSPSGWQRNALTTAANAPLAQGDPFGYDQGGIPHVVYRSASSATIYELYDSPSGWKKNQISVVAGAPSAASDPFAFVTGNGTIQHVVFRGVDNVVYELYEDGAWHVNPISQVAGAPLAASKPTGYVTAGDMAHVVYRSADNNIWELYYEAGWKKSRINTAANAPGGLGDPYGYATDNGTIEHVVYQGSDKNVYELYNTGGPWLKTVLNRLPIPKKSVPLAAPQAAGSPVGYATANGQHVVYRSSANGTGYIQEVHDVTDDTQGWTGATPNLTLSHELVALELATGAVLRRTVIQGSVPGTGEGSVAGSVSFDSKRQLQRPSLALANGRIYVAFSGVADTPPYHGWVFAYNASTFTRDAIFNSTPGAGGGGIWMSGQGPAVDANGSIYVITSNSTAAPAPVVGQNLGQAIVKFGPTLNIQDWFVPNDPNGLNFVSLNQADHLWDLSVAGPALIPGENRLYGGGEQGWFYLLDTASMGQLSNPNTKFRTTDIAKASAHGTPVFFDGDDGQGKRIYVWGESDEVRAFRYEGGQFQTPSAFKSGLIEAGLGSRLCVGDVPGGFLSISANGRLDGVVWATHVLASGGSTRGTQDPGTLTAFRASDLALLWDTALPTATPLGLFGKYAPPTIANGKVFVATNSGLVAVYGP